MGNFGDEFILSTIVDRLHERIPGSTVVAVGENPAHTLRARGVLSLTMADKRALDEALSYCSAALVAAGLLFDQGIRWTMGKAELISDMPHTDIPGIAAYAELAWLNGARPVFYGAGAGPLDVAAGRELVRLMGRLDALFPVRDDETAALIRSCGVPAGQVQTKADTAFLGRAGCCGSVDEWLDREGIDLGVSRLLAVSLREYENAPSDFASRVAAALDRAAQGHPDVEFAACVLDPGDLALACAVQRAMECGSRLHVFNAGDEIEPLADLLSRSSAGLSMRYHCSLLLGTFGVPCVGLGYLPKVVSLYRDLGQQDTLLDMDASCEQMASGLERVLGGDRTVTCELQARVGELRALAGEMEDSLVGIVGEVAPQKAFHVPHEFFVRGVAASDVARRDVLRAFEQARQAQAAFSLEVDAAREEVVQVRRSWSYRLGHALLTPMSWLKRAIRGLRRK